MNIYKSSILSITLVLYCFISFGQQRLNLSSDEQTYLIREHRKDGPASIDNKDNATYIDSILQVYFKVSLKEYCWQFLNQNLSYTVDFCKVDTQRFDSYIKQRLKSADPRIQTKPTIVNISRSTHLILNLDKEEKKYTTSVSLDGEQIFYHNADYQALLLNLSAMKPLLGFELFVSKNKNHNSAHLYFFSDEANQVKPKLQKMFDVKN